MKWSCESKVLAGALAAVRGAAEMKSTLPILSCVLIEAKGNEVTLTTTNLDVVVSLSIPVRVEKPGSAVVSCARLCVAVAKIGEAEVTVSLDKHRLVCRGGEWLCSLLTLAVEEFSPRPQWTPDKEDSRLIGAALSRALLVCSRFTSTDETRYVLNGILFDGALYGSLVATDSRRLVSHNLAPLFPEQCILPTVAAKLIASLCADTAEVRLQKADNMLFAKGEKWVVSSKLIDGNFPNYGQVIPPEDAGKVRVTVDRKALLAALPFVGVTVDSGSPMVKLEAGTKSPVLRISTTCADHGESSVSIEAGTKGGDLLAGFNPDFLRSAVECLSEDEITLAMADGVSPLRIDSEGTTIVLMPMRTN